MSELQEIVDELAARHGVPGAVVGVLEDGRVEAAAAGFANVGSRVEMTPDTLFLPGSVTKVWTTTLLMSLVEAGLVDLDAPVKRYLPDFELRAPGVADALVVRHLVTHSNGIDAQNMVAELGEGDEAIANYVHLLRDVDQLFEPGEYFSYNNAGFVLAGRIIEVVTGQGYSTAMRERLFAPMGLERSMLTAKEAIRHRTAIGHQPGADGYVVTPRFMMPECLAPAGATLITSVQDALTLMAHHLPSATAGPRFLSDESVALMAAHHIDHPVPGNDSCGLGWQRQQHGPHVVLTHAGGSYGGSAMAAAVPHLGAAYVAFVNGGAGAGLLHAELAQALLEKRFGLPPQDAPDLSGPTPEPGHYHGLYRCWGVDLTVTADGDALQCHPRFTDALTQGPRADPPAMRVRPQGPQALVLADHPDAPPVTYGVGDDGTGHARFLFMMGQFIRRIGDS